jgi:hypothetical protein
VNDNVATRLVTLPKSLAMMTWKPAEKFVDDIPWMVRFVKLIMDSA